MNKPLFHRRISSWLFGASRDAAFVSIILLLSIGLALSLIPWTLSSTVVPARVLALEGNTEPLGLYLRSGNETIRARILWGQYRDQEITLAVNKG